MIEEFTPYPELFGPTLEGVNRDIARLIKLEDVTKARAYFKQGKQLAKIHEYEAASAAMKKAIPHILNAKRVIDTRPEPSGYWEKIKSECTPILTLLPKEELSGIRSTPGIMNTSQGTVLTNNVELEYTTYADVLSKVTSSGVKRNLQLRMNLLLVKVRRMISVYDQMAVHKKKYGIKNIRFHQNIAESKRALADQRK